MIIQLECNYIIILTFRQDHEDVRREHPGSLLDLEGFPSGHDREQEGPHRQRRVSGRTLGHQQAGRLLRLKVCRRRTG